MPARLLLIFCGLLACFVLAASFEAEAARIGGGRSFGGKSFMSKPSAPPTSSMTQQNTLNSRQNPAAQAAAPNRGMFGGMGGMLGGLLAGSLIGSMLFGGGMGSGGGFLDIILIGGLLFLLFKFLGRRRAATSGAGGGSGMSASSGMDSASQFRDIGGQSAQPASGNAGGMGWDSLRSQQQPEQSSSSNVPADFDQEHFLDGAKMAYSRLNAAWDKRELDDIAQFATPSFMEELRQQAQEDPEPSQTDVLLVTAKLLEVRPVSDEEMASVLFDVVLREDQSQSAPLNVREIWHFVRNADGSGAWRLDGIQQIEQ